MTSSYDMHDPVLHFKTCALRDGCWCRKHTLLHGEQQQSSMIMQHADERSCLMTSWMTPARGNLLAYMTHMM